MDGLDGGTLGTAVGGRSGAVAESSSMTMGSQHGGGADDVGVVVGWWRWAGEICPTDAGDHPHPHAGATPT